VVGKPNIKLNPTIVPLLEQGDRLSRAEFERRYSRMPHVKKAELIEGIVQMASPVRAQHGNPHAVLIWLLKNYSMNTTGTEVSDNATVRMDPDNEPQPDALMYRRPEFGGKIAISPEGYFEGAPEFVAEVAASSVSIDLHTKLHVYRRNQVQEYLVWRVEDAVIDWFFLCEGKYVLLPSNSTGVQQSQVFPGLWLDSEAILGGDSQRFQKVLQEGLNSPEHVAFVQKLQQAEQERKETEGRPDTQ
jgi:hypothetical protein